MDRFFCIITAFVMESFYKSVTIFTKWQHKTLDIFVGLLYYIYNYWVKTHIITTIYLI